MNIKTLYPEDVDYIIFGEEVGEQGTKHLQGYIEFSTKRKMGGVKHILTERAHVEPRQGPQQAAIEYCKKEGHWYQFGEPHPEPGSNQWDFIKQEISHGRVMSIWQRYPQTYLKYKKAIEEMALQNIPAGHWDGDLKEKNIWLWGPAGVGKTKRIRDEAETVYAKNCNKWWDGFNNQQTVVIEDLDPTRANMLAQHLKIWADRYSFEAEVKGGTRRIMPSYRLAITSNYAPEACFQNPEDLEAIRRRFTVEHMVQLSN